MMDRTDVWRALHKAESDLDRGATPDRRNVLVLRSLAARAVDEERTALVLAWGASQSSPDTTSESGGFHG
jgi:hypothetical protein